MNKQTRGAFAEIVRVAANLARGSYLPPEPTMTERQEAALMEHHRMAAIALRDAAKVLRHEIEQKGGAIRSDVDRVLDSVRAKEEE